MTEEIAIEIPVKMEEFDQISQEINQVRNFVGLITSLKMKAKHDASMKELKETLQQLHGIMKGASSSANGVKASLKKIQLELDANTVYSALREHRQSLCSLFTRKFNETILVYKKESSSFQESIKDRLDGFAKVMNPNLSDSDLEKLRNDPALFEKFSQSMISGEVISCIADIEVKNQRILEIEQCILYYFCFVMIVAVYYINELFNDLAVLVTLSQEHLDLIEKHIDHARDSTREGLEDIIDGEGYAEKSKNVRNLIF